MLKRVPKCYGYGRVSHKNQLEGDSLSSQEKRVREYFAMHLEEDGVEWAGFFHDDKNVSAYRYPFRKRRVGAIICHEAQPGDHVVFDKLNRFSRNCSDAAQTIAWFGERGIHLHFREFGKLGLLDMRNPMGKLIVMVMAVLAEIESDTISERIREAKRMVRDQGLWDGSFLPAGITLAAVGRSNSGKTRYRKVWDEQVREVMREIVRLRDDEGLSFRQIVPLVKHLPAGMINKSRQRRWTSTTVFQAYYLEKTKYPLIEDPASVRELGKISAKPQFDD